MFARILLRRASSTKWLSVFGMLGAVGCVNVSTLQTARVLPPGDQMIIVGGGTSTFALPPEQVTPANGGLDTRFFGEILGRMGLIDGLDVGVRLSLLGTGSIDAKYQLLDKGPLAAAAGLSLGGMQITTSFDVKDPTTGAVTTTETKSTMIDVMVPGYVSYDFMEPLTAYVSPKILVRNVSSGTFLFGGVTGGVKVGDSVGLMLEATFFKGINEGANDSRQINAGFFWSR